MGTRREWYRMTVIVSIVIETTATLNVAIARTDNLFFNLVVTARGPFVFPAKIGVGRSMMRIRQGFLMAVGTAIAIVTTTATVTVTVATITKHLFKPRARGPYILTMAWVG
jgi:hypothetical protein